MSTNFYLTRPRKSDDPWTVTLSIHVAKRITAERVIIQGHRDGRVSEDNHIWTEARDLGLPETIESWKDWMEALTAAYDRGLVVVDEYGTEFALAEVEREIVGDDPDGEHARAERLVQYRRQLDAEKRSGTVPVDIELSEDGYPVSFRWFS